MEQFIVLDKNGPFKVEVSKLGVDTCFFFPLSFRMKHQMNCKTKQNFSPKENTVDDSLTFNLHFFRTISTSFETDYREINKRLVLFLIMS